MLSAIVYYGRGFAGFVAVIGIAYLIVRWLGACENKSRRWNRACAVLVMLLSVFALSRLQRWDQTAITVHSIPLLIYSLDMWLALRLMTLFWEVGSATVGTPTLSRFVVWACLPFTLGGPLLRFSEMPSMVFPDRRLWKSGAWWRDACAAAATLLAGITLGMGQQALMAYWPNARLLRNTVSTFFTGPFGFYLTTSGYFHLMEVLGRPAGFKIPPSFNLPFSRENISAFWMNWNMTATFVFRDYLFYNRWGRQTYNIYFNTLLLFTLVGLWHGANSYWILWGVLHGLLFCTFLLWRKHRSQLGHLPLEGTRASKVMAWGLTYFCICICWYLPSKVIQRFPAITF